ncbi:hypothetical protein TA3x_001646 [Tundrisphaera sp. TA3]|uniref:hypothetical protein n=1 Tax=Tundrisphaera sp. TA3 TaxID=3435775 RepID=UPI003EBB0AD5
MGNSVAAVTAMDRMLDQFSGCLNEEAARRVLAWKMDAETEARVETLGEKANQGSITGEERDEYQSYVEIADIIAILKLKAKRFLAMQDGD